MEIDIVLVTYNGKRWLQGCLAAIANSTYDCAKMRLFFVDHGSADGTLETLAQLKQDYPQFGAFTILQEENLGFGAGCNLGAIHGAAPWIFFLNVDTEIFPDCIETLVRTAETVPNTVASLECRQRVLETGHEIDPASLECPWQAGAGMFVRRTSFERVGGFDKHLFMYCEDVDLSWRLRALGETLLYVPTAQIIHYSNPDNAIGPKLGEYAGSFYGNLLLRYKYGNLRTIWRGHRMYLGALHRPLHFDHVRKILLRNYLKHFITLWPYLGWRFANWKAYCAKTARFEGGFSADRGQAHQLPLQEQPLVSILLTTGTRAETLRTLQSLAHQTYTNFEVVCDANESTIVEYAKEVPSLSYRVGEQKKPLAQTANGLYINELEAGTCFYPDHIELLLAALQAQPQKTVACSRVMWEREVGAGYTPQELIPDETAVERLAKTQRSAVLYTKQAYGAKDTMLCKEEDILCIARCTVTAPQA